MEHKMTVAIKVENLSKKYIIKHENKSANSETFSGSLIQVGAEAAHPTSTHPMQLKG